MRPGSTYSKCHRSTGYISTPQKDPLYKLDPTTFLEVSFDGRLRKYLEKTFLHKVKVQQMWGFETFIKRSHKIRFREDTNAVLTFKHTTVKIFCKLGPDTFLKVSNQFDERFKNAWKTSQNVSSMHLNFQNITDLMFYVRFSVKL